MCPSDDPHLTLEFDDHFVITPSIEFENLKIITKNAIGEEGNLPQILNIVHQKQ